MLYKRFIISRTLKKRGDYEKCFYKVLEDRGLRRPLWELKT